MMQLPLLLMDKRWNFYLNSLQFSKNNHLLGFSFLGTLQTHWRCGATKPSAFPPGGYIFFSKSFFVGKKNICRWTLWFIRPMRTRRRTKIQIGVKLGYMETEVHGNHLLLMDWNVIFSPLSKWKEEQYPFNFKTILSFRSEVSCFLQKQMKVPFRPKYRKLWERGRNYAIYGTESSRRVQQALTAKLHLWLDCSDLIFRYLNI